MTIPTGKPRMVIKKLTNSFPASAKITRTLFVYQKLQVYLYYFVDRKLQDLSGCHVGYVNDDYETLNGFESQVPSLARMLPFLYSHDS